MEAFNDVLYNVGTLWILYDKKIKLLEIYSYIW